MQTDPAQAAPWTDSAAQVARAHRQADEGRDHRRSRRRSTAASSRRRAASAASTRCSTGTARSGARRVHRGDLGETPPESRRRQVERANDHDHQDIVQKLWNLCNVLRDDGITYHQYVTELTYLLFLKMAKETEHEEPAPQGLRWDDLRSETASSSSSSTEAAAPPRHPRLAAGCRRSSPTPRPRSRADEPRTSSSTPSTARLVQREGTKASATSTRVCSRRTPSEKKSRRRPVLHAAPADRVHGRADQAAGRRAGSGPGGRHRRLSDRRRPVHQARTNRRSVHLPERPRSSSARGVLRRRHCRRTFSA